MGRKIRIGRDANRYLLSDVLPYEVPLSISNRFLVKFLKKYGISFSIDSSRLYIKIGKAQEKDYTNLMYTFNFLFQTGFHEGNEFKIELDVAKSIPYKFKINSGKGKQRTLSYIHPLNQIIMMAFNERYRGLILNYCAKSNFSLRSPIRVSQTKYFNDFSHFLCKVWLESSSKIEEVGKEYETIKSYYVYYRFPNIYRFYESDLQHRLERKFSMLSKIDIASCFDSIYTHSISWAVYNIAYIKNLRDKGKNTFPGIFDTIMQNMNYGETHGIVIGPEFARVFAEMILQRIDFDLEQKLQGKGYRANKHYAVLRYVDDYFIFYNDSSVFNQIKEILSECLSEYKLYLNSAKEITQERPHITAITIAKSDLKEFIYSIFPGNYFIKEAETDSSKKYNFNIPSLNERKIIGKIKSIVSRNNVKYGEVSNYLLFLIEKKNKVLLTSWLDACAYLQKKGDSDLNFEKYAKLLASQCFEPIVEILFFILAMDVSINAIISSSRIIISIIEVIKKTRSCYKNAKIPQSEFYRRIVYHIEGMINQCRSDDYAARTFCLHLINLAAELEDRYYINPAVLQKFMCEESPILRPSKCTTDYWSIVIVLRYIKNIKRYRDLKDIILNTLLQDGWLKTSKYKNCEQVLLFFDLMACPYIEYGKKELLFKKFNDQKYGVPSNKIKAFITFIKDKRISFTSWNWESFAKELAFKKADNVY